MARRDPPDRPPQRAAPALLGGARALAPAGPVRPPGGDGAPPDRRGIRAVDQPLPADRPDGRARLLDRRDRLDLHPVDPRHARRRPDRRPDPGPRPVRDRRHLPGGDDRAGGRAHHRAARAGRRDRRRRRGGRGRASDQPGHRDRDGRRARAAGRPARPGGGRARDGADRSVGRRADLPATETDDR